VKLVALDLLSMGIKSMALHIIVVDMLPGLAPIWSRMHAYTCVLTCVSVLTCTYSHAFICRYDEEDEALLMQADADVLQDRQKLADEWQSFCQRRAEYVALLDGFKASM